MSEMPSRDDLIGLLDKLGSERDEEVLEAARELQAQITGAGLDWDDLLARDAVAVDSEDRGPEPAERGSRRGPRIERSSNRVAASAGSGRPYRKPCTSSQPWLSTKARSSSVSTPSATTSRSR